GLPKRVPRFSCGVTSDDETVEAEADGPPVLSGGGPHVLHLLGEPVVVLSVAEVPIRHSTSHLASCGGVPALEDLRVRPPWHHERLRPQAEVVDPVEVSGEFEVLLRPQPAQDSDELLGAPVALVVLQPRFAEPGELVPEPTADDVH